MRGLAIAIFGIGAISAIIVALVSDLMTPAVPSGRCLLQTRFLLPDRCASSCPSGVDCPSTRTRPYMFFFTQAAACPDAVICG